MKLFRLRNRHIVPFAFFGEHMKHDRLLVTFGELERVQQHRQIVSVNRAQVTQAHFLENKAASITAAPIRLRRLWHLLQAHFRPRAFDAFTGFVRESHS